MIKVIAMSTLLYYLNPSLLYSGLGFRQTTKFTGHSGPHPTPSLLGFIKRYRTCNNLACKAMAQQRSCDSQAR